MSALRALRTLRATTSHPSTHRTFTTTHHRANIAHMTLVGRLAATPEATQTSTGQLLYRYGIGVSSGRAEQRETSWFNITAFMGEGQEDSPRSALMASLEKGTLLYVEADSKMVTLPAREGSEEKRRVLNLVQKKMQILSRPLASMNKEGGEGDA